MSFKKKLILLCVLVLTLTLCCFGLVACGGNDGGDVPNGGEEGKGEGSSTGGATSGDEGGSTESSTGGSTSGEESGSTGNEEPEDTTDWTLIYTISEDGSSITGLTENGKALSELTIPETFNGKTITSIGENAFKNLSSLTSITIGSSVTSIGSNAFHKCNNLNKVNYTETVDQWAQISFGSILSNPIYHTKKLYVNDVLLTEANLTAATKINAYAFYNCNSLTSATIGNSVTSIGSQAFFNCTSLTSVTFENTEGWYVSTSSTATSGTNLTLTDATQNATYLTSTHYNKYWKRK